MCLGSIKRFFIFHWLICTGVFLLVVPGFAIQDPTPAPPPPPPDDQCHVSLQDSVAPANIADLVVTILPETAWQRIGGTVKFTVEGDPTVINALVPRACFEWEKAGKDKGVHWFIAALRVLHSDPGKVTYGAIVPNELDVDRPFITFPWSNFPTDGLGLVPLAQFRVLRKVEIGWTEIGSDMQVGITTRWQAALLVIFLSVGAWWVLYLWAKQRGIAGGPILSIIANNKGYTSLSQLQITLWTFVIAGGAIYVMALSGNLIDVPTQALFLLGISGVSALATAALDPSSSNNKASTGGVDHLQPANIKAPSTSNREPRWSDLIVWDGQNEVDVTRVQMLFFTLIAAFFVILAIVNDRGIPSIPDGITQLLGLSNGIYIGGRYLGGRRVSSST